jgi:hypothetical protein
MFDGALHPVPVTVGVTDGVYTEVNSQALHEDTVLATSVPDATTAAKPSTSSSPLMPQQGPPRRF